MLYNTYTTLIKEFQIRMTHFLGAITFYHTCVFLLTDLFSIPVIKFQIDLVLIVTMQANNVLITMEIKILLNRIFKVLNMLNRIQSQQLSKHFIGNFH